MIFKSNFLHFVNTLSDLWNLTRSINSTALIYAAGEGHKEIVEILLRQKGIDINNKSILN